MIHKRLSKGIGRSLVALLSVSSLGAAGCQIQDPNAPAAGQTTPAPQGQYAPAPAPAAGQAAQPAQPAPNNSSFANSANQLVGVWGNSQIGMLFQLHANGVYQAQVQGRSMQGTWSMPQANTIVFVVNGQTTAYGYSVQGQQLALRDPNGQIMYFARGQAGQAQPPQRPPGQNQVASGPLPVPKRYRQYNAPVLAYMAETLSRQTPVSAAKGIRSLSPVAKQILAAYPAFGGLMLLMGCQADSSLQLYNWPNSGNTPMNCPSIHRQWQETIQLTQGSTSPQNCVQCEREALSISIGFQCTVGIMSKPECQAIFRQMQNINSMNHETMTRIISNMGTNTCVCGDPNCSC